MRSRATDLEAEGFAVSFTTNDRHLPSCSLGIKTDSLIGSFSSWENGLADYDFLDVRTRQATTEAMIPVDDSNFEAKFIAFVKRFRDME